MGVIVDFSLYALLVNRLGVHYQAANILSVSAGIATSFCLNATCTFAARDRLWSRFLLFYAVGLFGLALSATTLYVFVHQCGFDKNWVKLATLYVVFVQYNLNRLVSFAK